MINLYIRRIHDLQDARYCAAIAVKMLSFSVEDHDSKRLRTEQIKEMADWLSGPEVVIEASAQTWSKLNNVRFPFTWVSVDSAELPHLTTTELPLIVRCAAMPNWSETSLAYRYEFPFDRNRDMDLLMPHLAQSILVLATLSDVAQWIRTQPLPYAFSLNDNVCDDEGLINYEQLDAFLEALEIELN